MKIAKKIAAALLAAAMAFTALVIPVGADSIADTATAITSGKSVSTNLYAKEDNKDYKISVNSSGKLTISLESQMKEVDIYLFDMNGNKIEAISTDASSGKANYRSSYGCTECFWNDTIEKFKGSVSYSVTSGTYYIRFERYCGGSDGNGKLTFTATYPSATAKKAKISYININLAKGSTLSLGATVTNGGTVTWKSSNSSVVTVSSAGSITAKGKGSAIITAKCGSTSKKVKIVVS